VSDLIVYKGTLYNEYGHVSIVSQVFENEIEIIQQNPGPMAPSRERIPLIKTADGRYKLDHGLVLGWLRK
jgi:surface antigen